MFTVCSSVETHNSETDNTLFPEIHHNRYEENQLV